MILMIYFFIGFIAAVFGALPLGTTNVAVINATIKENVQSALKIIYTAGLAEVILIVLAILFNNQIEVFIYKNFWLQYSIIAILLIAGIVLLLGKTIGVKDKNNKGSIIKKRSISISKQTQGFFLGLANPMVLIYWIFIMSYLNKNIIKLNITVTYQLIGTFLIGAYLGKLLVLYGYGKFSDVIKVKMKASTTRVNRMVGALLLCVSILQITKLIYL